MTRNMFKKIPLFVGLVAASSSLVGGVDDRLAELEAKMDCVYTETCACTCGAKTACARPQLDGCSCAGESYYINVEAIYWKADVRGTEFAYSDGLDENGHAGVLPISGRTKEVDFDWSWGFKAGLGYNFVHDCWDINAVYTYFKNSGSDSSSGHLNDGLVPLRGTSSIIGGSAGGFTTANKATSQMNFDLNNIDLTLGRHFFVSSKLSLRPSFGLKSMWLDMSQLTRYAGGDQLGSNYVRIKDDSNVWGLGPMMGMNTKWCLGCGYSIFANIDSSLLWGSYDVKHKERTSRGADIDNTVSLTADTNGFLPTVHYNMGLMYDTLVNEGQQHVSLGVSFDAQYIWRANQMLNINDSDGMKYDRISEDVSTRGVTVSARFDF